MFVQRCIATFLVFILVLGLSGCSGILFGLTGHSANPPEIPPEPAATVAAAQSELSATLTAMHDKVAAAVAAHPDMAEAIKKAAAPILAAAEEQVATYAATVKAGGQTKWRWGEVWPYVAKASAVLLPLAIELAKQNKTAGS